MSGLPGDVSSLGLAFKLPEESPHDFWEETKKDKASVWSLTIQWDHRI
jgi:hypothetical protein